MESRVTDMTSGKPSKLILKFALPLMLGGVFSIYTLWLTPPSWDNSAALTPWRP